jgi:hypothetical protein
MARRGQLFTFMPDDYKGPRTWEELGKQWCHWIDVVAKGWAAKKEEARKAAMWARMV